MKYKIQPWPHQLEAINRAQEANYFGLLFEMGTGKTMTAINMMRSKYFKHGVLLRTLIICPAVVIENWVREIQGNSNINLLSIYPIDGNERRQKLAEVPDKAIVICSFETMTRPYMDDFLKKWPPQIIVVDEAHRLRNRGKAAQAIWKTGDNATYRYALTGSPVLQSIKDLWALVRFLDLGERFGRSHWGFEREHYYDANAGSFKRWRDMQPLPGTEEKLKNKIKDIVAVVRKSECLSLPPMIRQVIKIKITTEQAAIYEKIKKDFIASIGGNVVATPLVIVQTIRLQQLTAGYLPIAKEGGTEIHRFHGNPRLEALKDLLPEVVVSNKTIIWTVWTPTYGDLEDLCKKLKIGYVMLTGDTPTNKRQSIIDAFQNDPEIRVLIGNPGAAGIGINLTAASASIWYTRSYKLEHELQGDARNNRAGSERHETLFRWDIVAEGTLDEQIAERLEKKQSLGEGVLLELVKR